MADWNTWPYLQAVREAGYEPRPLGEEAGEGREAQARDAERHAMRRDLGLAAGLSVPVRLPSIGAAVARGLERALLALASAAGAAMGLSSLFVVTNSLRWRRLRPWQPAVVLYTSRGCPDWAPVHRLFSKRGVAFSERDLSDPAETEEAKCRCDVRIAPITVIGKQALYGAFEQQRSRLEALLP